MRAIALFIVLTAGCNLVFKAEPARDAPGSGGVCSSDETPAFLGAPIEIAGAGCTSYSHSVDADLAVAECTMVIQQGTIDGQLAKTEIVGGAIGLALPKLAPEGDELFLRDVTSIEVYDHGAGGAEWAFAGSTSITGAPAMTFSAPTRRNNGRRILVHDNPQAPAFDEYENTVMMVWSFKQSHGTDLLGVASLEQPNLTDDGLHLVFRGTSLGDGAVHTFHAARTSLEDDFRDAKPLALPSSFMNARFPFLTSDCARLYVTAPNALSYIPR